MPCSRSGVDGSGGATKSTGEARQVVVHGAQKKTTRPAPGRECRLASNSVDEGDEHLSFFLGVELGRHLATLLRLEQRGSRELAPGVVAPQQLVERLRGGGDAACK